ncbi:hypothetical protein CsatB_009844 [Cannabis sativa]|uniref:Knottins-like domain-containing protein n=1 Tax=Cannabis sativa TaxID=3483 RepID=A0A803QTY3_CANSA
MERKVLTVLLLIVVLISHEISLSGTEAKTCEVESEKYSGLCLYRDNCVEICQSEGFPYGKCSKIRRRCMCLKPCV